MIGSHWVAHSAIELKGVTDQGHCYRPQHSCGKVMFSQVSVILFTGGVCVVGGVHGGGHVWQGVCGAGWHVWQGEGACMAEGHAWQGGHVWQGACMTGEMTTAADGTHPTGMHSCFIYVMRLTL